MKNFFYTLFAILAFAACSESDVDVSPLIRIEETENSLMLESFMTSKSVSFYTNRDWTATTDAEWLEVYPTSGTAGNVEIKITADKNETYESRTSSVKISIEGAVQEFSITQMQRDAIVVAQSEYEVSVDGGALDFEVQANVDLTITISDNAKSWIEQVESRALESKMLHFDIKPCSADENREGIITIAGKDTKHNIKVKQSGMAEVLWRRSARR